MAFVCRYRLMTIFRLTRISAGCFQDSGLPHVSGWIRRQTDRITCFVINWLFSTTATNQLLQGALAAWLLHDLITECFFVSPRCKWLRHVSEHSSTWMNGWRGAAPRSILEFALSVMRAVHKPTSRVSDGRLSFSRQRTSSVPKTPSVDRSGRSIKRPPAV